MLRKIADKRRIHGSLKWPASNGFILLLSKNKEYQENFEVN
jgi:hypothetical protein